MWVLKTVRLWLSERKGSLPSCKLKWVVRSSRVSRNHSSLRKMLQNWKKKVADRSGIRLDKNEFLNLKLKFTIWHKVSEILTILKIVSIGNLPKYLCAPHIRHWRSALPLPAGSETLHKYYQREWRGVLQPNKCGRRNIRSTKPTNAYTKRIVVAGLCWSSPYWVVHQKRSQNQNLKIKHSKI